MEKNKRIISGKKRRKLKRGMGILLAMAVVLNTLPLGGLVVSASENKEVGICTHHKEHTKDCGYSPASNDEKGSPCTYECNLCPIEDLIAALPQTVAEAPAASDVAPQAEDTIATIRQGLKSYNYTSVQEAWEVALNMAMPTIEIVQDVELNECLSMNNSSSRITLQTASNVKLSYSGSDSMLRLEAGELTINRGNFSSNSIVSIGGDAKLYVLNGTFNVTDPSGTSIRVESGSPTVSLSGGSFVSDNLSNVISPGPGKTITDLLHAGYGYQVNGGWLNDDSLPAQSGTLTVAEVPVSITTQPQGGQISDDKTLTLSVKTQGSTSTITYQWYQDGTLVPDATSADYTPTGLANGTYQYYCVVSGDGYKVQSNTVTVTVSNCDHAGTSYTPESDDKHSGTCSKCGMEISGEHTLVGDTCSVCGVKAVAKVEKDGGTTYVTSLENAFASGNSGATVTLLQDVNLSSMVSISNNFILNLNGHTITHNDGPTLSVGGSLTIRGSGSVQSNASRYSSVNVAGTVTLEGGSFSGISMAAYDDSALYVTGVGVNITSLTVSSTATVFLSAGTYSEITAYGSLGKLLLNYGEESETHYAYFDESGNPIPNILTQTTLTDPVTVRECTHPEVLQDKGNGTHGGDCPYCGTAFVATPHTLGTGNKCEECNAVLVVKVETSDGNTIYLGESDFAKAFDDLNYNNVTVTLLSDIQPDSIEMGEKQASVHVFNTSTLDLAGHTITSSDTVIFVWPSGNLTIKDSSPGKTGKVISTNSAAILAERSASLMGGTYIGNPAVDGKNSSTSMGSLLANYNRDSDTHYAYFDVDGNPITNILTEKVLAGPVTVKECKHDASVCEYQPLDGGTSHKKTCLACGMTWDAESHTDTDHNNQCDDCGAALVAKVEIGGDTTYYGTIESAWTAAQGKTATVTLLANVTATTYLEVDNGSSDITFNGGNYTLTSSYDYAAVEVRSGTLTIASGTIDSSVAGGVQVDGGTLKVIGGKVKANKFGIQAVYGIVWISGGEIIGSDCVRYSNADVKISGGTITGSSAAIRVVNGKASGVLLNYDNPNAETHYAFYQGEQPVKLPDGDSLPSGTYTVQECTEEYTYAHAPGTTKHTPSCQYCGAGDGETDCSFTWTDNVGECACGTTLIVGVTGTDNLVYNGSAHTLKVIVTLDGEPLVAGTDYTVSYSDNIDAGDASVVVSDINGANWKYTQNFNILQAKPNIGKVTAQELENTLDISKVALKRENQTPAGTLKLIDGSTLQYGTETYTWKFTPDDTANYLSVTGTVQITINDTIPPTAKYQIGTDKWKEFVKTISFGLFCKDYKTVELEFTDDTDEVKGSGIAKKQYYYISDKEITEFDNIEWNEYTKTIYLDAKGTYFIYVNVSDNAGNKVILNSEGIVIYEESALSPAAFDYTYKQNKDCTVQLTMNGNTFKTLTDNKGNVISTSNYTVENGKLTLKAAYLDMLDKGEYTYKIYMNPQGVETDKKTLVYTFTVKVKAKELTVTGATATDRDYNGTNVVEITKIALSGIAPDDDVSVDLNGIQGILSSANAGKYDSVTLPKLTLKGTSKSNYILVQPTKAVATSVTIEKAATEITVGTSIYDKTFGDGAFTLDVTDNNLEKDVQYKVTEREDVVSVENGTVNIKSAGTATITVSLQESANYKAATDKTITVKVAKKSGYTVEAVNKSYLYTKENADTIDLAVLLPRDCGMVNYGTPSTSGDVKFETSAVDHGKLSYTLGSGNASDKGTITVIATTQNYEDITITVNVKLTDKILVKIKGGTKVILKNDTLNFGEALSTLIFDEVDFVDSEGNKVEGILTWKKEETIPDAGTTSATWQFLPTNDSEYEILEGIAAITVNKAVPVVDAVPTVTERVYNPSVTLKNIGLTGGKVSVEGSWSWERANIVPSVDNSGYVAVFTPTDKTNYETVTKTIVVKVTKATPYIKTAPSAAVITYGDALSVSNLAGGVVQYSNDDTVSGYDTTISGSFAWKDDSQKPVVAGSKAYEVVFTPADGANYNSVEITVTPTVLKAENAPNMPNSTMNVLNSCKKVSDVTLPDGWEWQEVDKDTDLEVGKEANAVAIYTGTDKGNYEKEMVTVAITRISCDHVAGEILYTGTGEKAPTCTENGLGHRECTKCHSLMESEIVVTAFGHIHTELRGTVEATCMVSGYTGDSYCKDCGVKIADGTATGKLAHNYTSRITKEPTTTEEGVRTYTCMGCGNSYIESISKLPQQEHKHSYSSQITKEATCAEKGIRTYRCICGDSYTESIPVLNHSYTNWKSDETNHWHECSSCGDKKDTTIHTEDSGTVTKQPTETETGIRTYSCSVCQRELRTEIIDKLDHTHTYEAEWKSDEKNHWHECSSCGDKKDTTIHTEDSGTVTKQPTETETGIRTYSCSVCQRELRTEIIDKLNHTHTYEAEWKSDEKNHWHECSSCGDKKDTTTHTEDSGTVTKQPTETETGIRTYSCSVCQRELRTEIIDKLNHTHTYEAEWKSDEKNHWHECSCGEKSEKSNHNFRAWVVVKQPTEEKEGMRKRDCTVCGYQQTEKISKKEADKNKLALNAGLKVSQTGSQINIAWGKVSGASGYDVYVQYCGMKFSAKSSNQVKGGTKTKTIVKKVNGKKLDLKKSYKVYVVAYKLTGGKKVTISKSITAHIIGRNNKKYTNVKAVTVKKNSYILKKGKTAVIQAKTSLVSKGKKELPNSHTDKFRYESSNKKVATVSAKGKIQAIGKGSCIIYIYAQNGYAKKIKVTVK